MLLFFCDVYGAKVQKKSDIHKDFIQKNAKKVDFPPRKHPENRKFHPKPPQKVTGKVTCKVTGKSDGKKVFECAILQ